MSMHKCVREHDFASAKEPSLGWNLLRLLQSEIHNNKPPIREAKTPAVYSQLSGRLSIEISHYGPNAPWNCWQITEYNVAIAAVVNHH